MRILRAGIGAVLIELDGLEQVVGLHAALRRTPPAGTVDLVPAARTLLVIFDRFATTADDVAAQIRQREIDPATEPDGPLVEVPVVYDGEDLTEVAGITGLTEKEVVVRHLRPEYRAAFCGFAPGFAYLAGGDPVLRVPRRNNPRTSVPAGSVGLADQFTGVYPRQMPGGWQLIGRTDAVLWDLDREPPALLAPGTRVRFVEGRQ
ncbi:MAG TPA: 5-oxoprolinase subunit PxpB [Micromonosporaceae bacterium]|nr:5-oxoprolinase subunit PxpB [Micromonosporaceae bacterium]